MAKKLLRTTAILAVASMLLALAACSSAAPPPTTAAPVVSASGSAVAEPVSPPSAEPVTLKYWTGVGATGTSGIPDNPVMKQLTERTGVTLDLVFNITAEQISAMIASGDLPDALTVWIAETTYGPGVPTLLASNDMIDMEPLLAEHGKDIQQDKGKVQYGKDFLSGGSKKLYFLPIWGLGLDAPLKKSFDNGLGIGMYVRWDLYKQLGYPEVKNDLTDIIPILKQMQDLQPQTADGKKVYGLSPWFADWGLWNFLIYPEGLNGIDAEEGGFVDINPVDLSIKSQIGDTNSTLWQGARFYYLANQAGVLDPDSVMQKVDQAGDKMSAGRVLMGPCNWAVSGANGAFAKDGHPEQGFMAVKLPAKYTQALAGFKCPYTDRWAQGITVKCKTPERAMDLLNFLNSDDGMRLLVNGVEGVNWNVGSDGLPHLTTETLNLMLNGNSEDLDTAGLGGYTHLYGKSYDALDHKYNCPMRFQFNEDPMKLMETATPYEKDFTQHYGVQYPDQLWEQTVPSLAKVYDGSFLQMVEPAPDDIKQIDTNLTNYLVQNLVQIVMASNDEEYTSMQAKIIADCKGMGYETAFNWHKAAYEAAMGKQAAFYEEIK
jgi:putative aldouronate transport system substrate-binding protein